MFSPYATIVAFSHVSVDKIVAHSSVLGTSFQRIALSEYDKGESVGVIETWLYAALNVHPSTNPWNDPAFMFSGKFAMDTGMPMNMLIRLSLSESVISGLVNS